MLSHFHFVISEPFVPSSFQSHHLVNSLLVVEAITPFLGQLFSLYDLLCQQRSRDGYAPTSLSGRGAVQSAKLSWSNRSPAHVKYSILLPFSVPLDVLHSLICIDASIEMLSSRLPCPKESPGVQTSHGSMLGSYYCPRLCLFVLQFLFTGILSVVCGWRRNGFAQGSRGTNCSSRLTFSKRSAACVRSVQRTVLSRILFFLFVLPLIFPLLCLKYLPCTELGTQTHDFSKPVV